jgi:dephospho-CoA kinase
MITIGLTGGIASGKTTILNFIKKQNIPIHDSDEVVANLYEKPTIAFISYLESIGLKKAIKEKKINKNTVRSEFFHNKSVLTKLETFIHQKTKISRTKFLKNNMRLGTKLVVLDIPLLFEKKLENICDYIFLAYSPIRTRRKRALKRNRIKEDVLNKIIDLQLEDRIKINKSDFVINTSIGMTYSNNQVLRAIKNIKHMRVDERNYT